jgi:hypothetical protein
VKNPYMPNMYFAGGCMRSPDSDVFMPLSLAAVPDPENGTYEVTIYSTVVPGEWEPFVIRFTGAVEVHGKGVTDDVAGGEIMTDMGSGQWNGVHHDRRRTKCPSAGYGQFVQADVRLSKDLAYDPPQKALVLELYTVVVSTAMQVDMPDGSTRVIEPYTDLFSPYVDFVGRFRFFEYFEGEQPVVGEPYTFRLLDMFGNPIPGTESTDVFWRCTQDVPINVRANDTSEDDVTLEWDSVPVITGEFEPEVQGPDSPFHLPYQVNVHSATGGLSSEFGALGVSNWHLIPWDAFEPGGDGLPDGFDFGQSLSSFEDGLYQIELDSWNMPVVDQGGHYQDCEIHDSSENLMMEMSEGNVTFTPSRSISGVVTSSSGDPIADIWVDACEYDDEENPYCQSSLTNDEGKYRITGLLPGDYRVQTGNDVWVHEFFDDTYSWDEAARVAVMAGADTENINFALEQGGSISGNVSDAGGPLADVHVDACAWDDSFCFGAETDSDGNYTIFGLPAGDYRAVVWGDQDGWFDEFYQEKQFHHEADPVSVVGGSDTGGINFTMEIFVEPSLQYLNVQPDHMWADSGGWTEGTEVTLSIGSYSASQFASADGNVWFDISGSSIAPGVNVNVTDGVDSKDLLVVSASFDGVDDAENTAWGTAPADAWLGVAVVDENGYEYMYWVDGVQADADGYWLVDFDDYGQDFGAVNDAWVHVFDEDGDSTLAHLEVPAP